MKSTIVPAQITTVEDKIAGSLSMSQLVLLCTPIFIDGVLYILFPPGLKFVLYKVVLCIAIALICASMAVRIKGKILLLWAIVIVRYNLRPRLYVLDKNDTYLRDTLEITEALETEDMPDAASVAAEPHVEVVTPLNVAHIQQLLLDHRAELAIQPTKKGGFRVILTEVE